MCEHLETAQSIGDDPHSVTTRVKWARERGLQAKCGILCQCASLDSRQVMQTKTWAEAKVRPRPLVEQKHEGRWKEDEADRKSDNRERGKQQKQKLEEYENDIHKNTRHDMSGENGIGQDRIGGHQRTGPHRIEHRTGPHLGNTGDHLPETSRRQPPSPSIKGNHFLQSSQKQSRHPGNLRDSLKALQKPFRVLPDLPRPAPKIHQISSNGTAGVHGRSF